VFEDYSRPVECGIVARWRRGMFMRKDRNGQGKKPGKKRPVPERLTD